MDTKPFWESKTFWVNLFAAAGMVLQQATGSSIGAEPETQATALAVVNIVLRAITSKGLSAS